MPAKSIGSASAEIISMAKAARKKGRVAKPKPPPAVLPDGKHFSRCPAAAVFDQGLTDGELRGLAAAGAFTGKDGTCRASQSTIARRLKISRQVVHRWFTSLVAKGYLRLVRRTTRANGSDGPNVYKLVYPPLPELESGQAKDAQDAGGPHPTSGTDDICVSGLPGSIAPRQLHG